MDHLDVVTSTLITNPVTAWLAVGLGSNVLEDVLDVWPGLLVTTGHERWAISGTFLTTRDTSPDKSNTLLCKVLGSSVGVWVVGVATINDDITLVAVWEELLNEVVNSWTGHDKQHHSSWLLQLLAELLNRVSTFDGLACNLCQPLSLLFRC